MCLAFTKHQSIKYVIIDDVRVVAVTVIVKLAVVAYTIYSLLNNFGYMAVETPIGAANVWAQGYQAGDTNAMPNGICNGSAAFDFVYDSTWQYLNNRCRPFAYGEVIRKKVHSRAQVEVVYSN